MLKKSVALGKSFINSMKRRGPKMLPYGTPQRSSLSEEFTPLMDVTITTIVEDDR